MIQEQRIKILHDAKRKPGKYVLYWMQQSQRAEYNHALEYSIRVANRMNKPLVVFFGITENFPEANERHYYFMLEGLKEVQEQLRKRRVQMVVRLKSPEKGVLDVLPEAAMLITDRGYLHIQRQWRKEVAEQVDCRFVEVESDVLIPVEVCYPKEAYSAAVLRRRIDKYAEEYLVPLKATRPQCSSLNLEFESVDLSDIDALIAKLYIDKRVKKSPFFTGGTSEAKKRLDLFIESRLDTYDENRNDPSQSFQSDLSPYLHFGQISPLYIALKCIQTQRQGTNPYLEELIVRRELSMNFVFYNDRYDSCEALPDWARETLDEHRNDEREYVYSLEEFEQASTHDKWWNTAQREMVITGKMHGYMRMYWGKKILEWTPSPEEALRIALYLNNKYELDGRDANAFTGVLWCFGKHDRPWRERPIFGKIRYMSESGLIRKFSMEQYAQRVAELEQPSS